ncbi:tetratricopeptide repeat protein [Sphingopyxis panaciterrulae]|uniref:SPOR domain-containing protein n=1 Tax=Sphingopyxis panaciterrulae TaxID=462372 RepID=A0A7W9ER31_9SPHN|nr:SPOR domain-containing protein [Sphingopyxis panaciterrulae]MBB5707263.1 hypothetical protein [Sphingopyxis panaciterrulae]
MTARPGHARRRARVLGLLLASALALPAAAQIKPPDPATKAAMDRRTAARTLLSSALGRIAANANDARALLDAGRASIDLEDYRAALGFLLRAEKAASRDGQVKATLGSVMVHLENPTRALDYFGEAQLLGAPERLFLADRGLARDLLGQQDQAQRDYQLALSAAPSDELTRRYALSLGISGDPDRAVALLAPQLRRSDRAAWRSRAMILAMNGRNDEATQIVRATLPPQLAENILPYLLRMDRLNPAQMAAAAHFGRFPSGELGPRRPPVQMAAATPAPTPAPTASRRRTAAARPATAAAPTPTPAPAPAAVAVRRTPVPTPAPAASRPAPTPAPVPATAVSKPAPTPTPAPIGVAVDRDSGPVGPGFSIADMGSNGAARPGASTAPPAVAATPAPTAAAPLASLAEIVSSIEIPPEEMAKPDNAVGADTLARLLEDKRKAEAAEAAKREKEEAAAKAKAEAEAKARAEAEKKKANPARVWVQIATGSNLKALAFDYNRFAKRNAALFKGQSGSTADWGQTRRLLVGPFKDRKSAQAWLADYKKAEGDGFLFDSEVGEIVEPLT